VTRDDAWSYVLTAIGKAEAVPISSELWIASAVLGGLRQAANDTIRASHRSRGDAKNASGDLGGSFAELLVATVIERRLVDASVRVSLLNWDSPGNDVDAEVEVAGHTFLIEAKCHLHEVNKRLFLVNEKAAERSRARGALDFMPVLSRAGSDIAMLGRPLPMDDVLEWPVKDFGYEDPARWVTLNAFVPRYFGLPLVKAIELVTASSVVSVEELTRVTESARGRFEELRQGGLQIDLTPGAAKATLVSIAR
jgi:hypothetical protein